MPGFRQHRLNRKTAIGLFGRMNVIKVRKIMAHDKQMKRHFVQQIESLDRRSGFGMRDRKAKLEWLARLD